MSEYSPVMIPVIKGDTVEEENLMIKEIIFQDIKYDFSINKACEKIKFILFNDIEKYEKEFTLKNFHSLNQYFKMFDNIDELIKDLIDIISEKEDNTEIIYGNNQEISVKIKIKIRKDIKIVEIKLKKREINQKDKIKLI